MEFLYFISTDEWVGWEMGWNINKKKKKEWENYCQEIHCCVLLLLAYLILSSQQIYKIVFPFLSNIDHHLIYILCYSHSNIIYVLQCYSVYIGKFLKELFLYLYWIQVYWLFTKSTNLLQIWIIFLFFTRIFKYH